MPQNHRRQGNKKVGAVTEKRENIVNFFFFFWVKFEKKAFLVDAGMTRVCQKALLSTYKAIIMCV
jgi:hypothetical protein